MMTVTNRRCIIIDITVDNRIVLITTGITTIYVIRICACIIVVEI